MEELPNDLNNIIKDFIIFKPKTKQDLQEAVDLWCENRYEALKKYGHVSNWNTSLINDMSDLFLDKKDFNDNINNWNVSNVTNMHGMFSCASSFNQPLDSWDVSSVKYMGFMFCDCASFNQDLTGWNTSQIHEYGVTDMFRGCKKLEKRDQWYDETNHRIKSEMECCCKEYWYPIELPYKVILSDGRMRIVTDEISLD